MRILLILMMLPMLCSAQVGAKYSTIKKGKTYTFKNLKHHRMKTYNYSTHQEIYDFYGTSDSATFYAVAFKTKAFEKKYMDTTVNDPKKFQSIVDPVSFKRDRWIDLKTNTLVYYAVRPSLDINKPIPYSALVFTNNKPLPVPDGPNGMEGKTDPNQPSAILSNPRANKTVAQPPKKKQ